MYVAVIVGGESATAIGLAKSLVAGKVEVHLFTFGNQVCLAAGVFGVDTHHLDKLDFSLVERFYRLAADAPLAIFPATDEAVLWVDLNRASFRSDWLVPKLNDVPMLTALSKVEMQGRARDAGFSIPRTLVVGPGASVLDSIDASWFPVIVKPLDSLSGGKESMAVLPNETSLVTFLRQLATQSPIMLQEYVTGDSSGGIYEVFAAFNPLLMREPVCVVARKIRIFPDLIGSSSAIQTINDMVLQKLVVKYIRLTGFVGILDLECVRRDGLYYFVEVNYRCGTPIDIARAAGLNIPLLWIGRDERGSSTSPRFLSGKTYVREPSEVAAAVSHRVSWGSAFRFFLIADTRLIVDGRHPLVAIRFLWQKINRKFRAISFFGGIRNGS